jgi:predicted KAP-like P-loop ATPase
MDERTYKMYKDGIREAEDEITHLLLDQNLVTPSILRKIEENIQRIKAFSMNVGGYFLEAGLEEENKRKYGKVLEAQESAIKQNLENDNRRTEIAEESLELNKKSIENQIDLKKNRKKNVKMLQDIVKLLRNRTSVLSPPVNPLRILLQNLLSIHRSRMNSLRLSV